MKSNYLQWLVEMHRENIHLDSIAYLLLKLSELND